MPFRILSISYDSTLLRVRQQMLESRGYTVISGEGFVQALKLCHQGQYDLAIIGHSIPSLDKVALLNAIQRHCPVPVIALLRWGEQPLEGAAASLDAMNPQQFLAAVDDLLKRGGDEYFEKQTN